MHISISFNCYACTPGLLQGTEQYAALNMCTYNIFICLFVQENCKERETEKGSVYVIPACILMMATHYDKFSERVTKKGEKTRELFKKKKYSRCSLPNIYMCCAFYA